MKAVALVLFIATYILLIALPKRRPQVAVISGVIYILLGFVSVRDALGCINYNVLLMLAGTMGTVSLFIQSKMPNRMAEVILEKTPNVMWAAVAMSLFSGVISAFVDNVATVLMLAPVGLAIAKKLNISPVALLISISVSSNLQGAATLVGDTTSIMLGGYADMNFMEFFFLQGKFSIFWAVELGAVATVPIIILLFRRQRDPVTLTDRTEVSDYVPTVLLGGTVILLIIASFLPNTPDMINGMICMAVFLAGAVYTWVRDRSPANVLEAVREIDCQTLCLLAGLFVVIEGIGQAGIIADISNLFVRVGGENIFLLYTVIVFGSVVISAFVDNIPYVATMLPVVSGIASGTGSNALLLYFGLLIGATLGGNITPVGASANITTIGILRRHGYEVKSAEFFRIGIPFTMAAVLAGYAFCWLVWA